ncbi:MAG: single-stranded-DNA-specific exonuclease RecJ [Lachnospiraceae bacterium]|nr:single-stranded-DNA-specific exonuclease RecJ [Lachnospiraceae bacterium]
MANWYVAAKKADFNQIAQKFGISPVLARIIRNRDIITEEEIEVFLHGTIKDLHSPFLLKDMDKAVEIIWEKVKNGRKIRIIGDYDIDGVCSAYILEKGLKESGALVDTVIPHRIRDGYGLNDELIKEAKAAGVDTILTCDNGIAAMEQIALAKELGMSIVVTDHHEVPYEEADGGKKYLLPKADAVIDPKQEDCPYPYKGICGAVVAYKFIQAFYGFRTLDFSEGGKGMETLQELFCFAAFATIGDVMELTGENRIFVKYGLPLMEKTENPGLKALILANGLAGSRLTPYHVGFVLGPCINATGRLDTAERALQLFASEDEREAAMIAGDLKAFNDSRKDLTAKGMEEAVKLVEGTDLKKDHVLVVYLPECHESLAGIIAGRLREKYGKPVFVLTKGEEEVKGSGRSIEAFHMYENMTKVKDLFLKYGGHKLAAGLSIKEERVEEFRERINGISCLTEKDFEETVHIDVPMPIAYGTMEFVRELRKLEPYGVGNKKPLFAEKNISFLRGRLLGKNGNVLKCMLEDERGYQVEAIYFGDTRQLLWDFEQQFGNSQVELFLHGKSNEIKAVIAYYPDINEFRGQKSLQLVIMNYSF